MGFFDRFASKKPQDTDAPQGRRADDVRPAAAPSPSPAEAPAPPAPAPSATPPSANAANVVRPLSQESLKRVFDAQGWNYGVDEDGDLGGKWDGNQFFFMITGDHDEILRVVSRWAHPIDSADVDAVRQFIDDWHRDRIWPKLALIADGGDEYYLHTAHCVDYEWGVADSQLLQHSLCAIQTTGSAYKALAENLGVDDTATGPDAD